MTISDSISPACTLNDIGRQGVAVKAAEAYHKLFKFMGPWELSAFRRLQDGGSAQFHISDRVENWNLIEFYDDDDDLYCMFGCEVKCQKWLRKEVNG
ncbi:Protein of unknown function [Gryllus bimaculatus]|nr:Protein of unknown function [Gryllus bimaculatus]